jgi:hypothetical protein
MISFTPNFTSPSNCRQSVSRRLISLRLKRIALRQSRQRLFTLYLTRSTSEPSWRPKNGHAAFRPPTIRQTNWPVNLPGKPGQARKPVGEGWPARPAICRTAPIYGAVFTRSDHGCQGGAFRACQQRRAGLPPRLPMLCSGFRRVSEGRDY